MKYETNELKKTDKALKESAIITIHAAYHVWTSPDGTRWGWELVIEHMGQLSKVMTYDESLAKQQGMTPVEFYRNSQGRCVRRG